MVAKFKTGDVVKIFYFVTTAKHRRMLTFTGICTDFNRSGRTFTLKNFCNTEYVTFNFPSNSPNIVAADLLKSYNFKFKQARLHDIRRLRLIGKTDLFSPKYFETRRDPLRYFYVPSAIFPKEKKRLRNKFRL